MAASMVIAVGTISFVLAHSSPALPETFQVAAVSRHDHCLLSADHHGPAIPQASFQQIGQYLRQELNHPVLAANLANEQWEFRGAAICPVGGVAAAHLLYQRGDQTLSIFSLPASCLPSLEHNETYEGNTRGHSVVARAENGALYCLVGHCTEGELTVADLGKMLSAHEPEAAVAAVPGPRITVAGIFREP